MFKTEPGDKKVHYYGCSLKRVEGIGIFELCDGHYIYEFYYDDEEYIYKYAKEVSEEEKAKFNEIKKEIESIF